MDRRDFLLLTSGAVAMVTLAAESASSAQAQSTEPVLSHPRLYFDPDRIRQVRTRVQEDPALAAKWRGFLESANHLLTVNLIPESVADKGQGDDATFGGASHQIGEMGLTLGLVFHVTEGERYAEKLRAALLHFASYSKWHGPGFSKRIPAWHSELNTARFCFGVATGYDALAPVLSAAERHTIRDALIRLGILPTLEDWVLPESRIHALDSMGHNWWAVCVSNAGVGALSLLGEEPRAQPWIDRVCDALHAWFNYRGNVLQNKSLNFDSKGAFYESVNYANYALFEYLRFRLAYSHVFPGRKQAHFEALERACDYFFQTFYPSSSAPSTVNFGDSSIHLQVAPTIRLLLENSFSHPAAGWYLAKTSPTPDVWEILAREAVPQPAIPSMPQSVVYSDTGWGILRNSWEDDATLLAVKSGFTWNHAHADAGSFVLFHAGVPLIIDSGSCGYLRQEYTQYYVQSEAHNVVRFQGKGEPSEDHERGVKFPGSLYGLIDDFDIKYLYADATGPMAHAFSRNYRHWLWIDGVILIFDDLLCHQEGLCEWLLHYEGKSQQKPAGVLLTNGSARADVISVYPEDVDVREEMGLAEHDPDHHVPYFVFRSPESSRLHKFVTAIVAYTAETEEKRPMVHSAVANDTSLGVRVERNGVLTDVFLNLQADGRRMHLNSNNNISGWETDAYLVAWTRPAAHADDPHAVTRLFVSCGSYLRRSDCVYFHSLVKRNAVWNPQMGI